MKRFSRRHSKSLLVAGFIIGWAGLMGLLTFLIRSSYFQQAELLLAVLTLLLVFIFTSLLSENERFGKKLEEAGRSLEESNNRHDNMVKNLKLAIENAEKTEKNHREIEAWAWVLLNRGEYAKAELFLGKMTPEEYKNDAVSEWFRLREAAIAGIAMKYIPDSRYRH